MKAEELMVGDWVYGCTDPYDQDEEQKKYPVKVIKIDIDGDTWTIGNNPFTEPYEDEWWELEPIPITPEILEKNGFKNIGDDCWQLEDHPNYFWVDFYTHQYGCEHAITFDSDEHRLKLYGIPNVHELQHALRFCGIEKEIVL